MDFKAESISKSFNLRRIIRDVSFEAVPCKSIAITGRNGSGKTTLLRILCSLLRADRGKITFTKNGSEIRPDQFKNHIGLVGPYLQLYDELTAYENLIFAARLKKIVDPKEKIMALLDDVGLPGRAHDAVKAYSSGMKQRLKYALATLARPDILFLDEPASNLDKDGIDRVYNIMKKQREQGILIFATNDKPDLQLADQIVDLNA